MKSHRTLAAAVLATVVGTSVGVGYAQQGTPSQPGTPSAQPGPKNPVPPATSQPGNPVTKPVDPPAAPPANDPNVPAAQPGTDPQDPATMPENRPGTTVNRAPGQVAPLQERNADNAPATRYSRPFAFQSPDEESRFTESSRRLVRLEQRMERSNQELLKKLGDARQLTGERQNAALLDVLQMMLRENMELQKYLVQSRSSFTGDIDMQGEVPTGENPPAARDDRQNLPPIQRDTYPTNGYPNTGKPR